MRLASLAVLVALPVALAGCPSPGKYKAPAVMPTAQDVVAQLAKTRAARTAFRAESVMDYWLGDQRVKGTVYVMGTQQRQVRFNAISPQQDVLADMACDGTNFTLVDMQHNCQLTGPCTKQSLARFLRVELEPEDVLHLALGTVPVLENATGTVTWDAAKGYERVELKGPGGTQRIVIDARDGRADVVSSELIGMDGKVVWSVENAGFEAVKDEAGGTHRLPTKTRFKSPTQQADLLVEWKERVVNPTLDPAKFAITVPAGLPTCR